MEIQHMLLWLEGEGTCLRVGVGINFDTDWGCLFWCESRPSCWWWQFPPLPLRESPRHWYWSSDSPSPSRRWISKMAKNRRRGRAPTGPATVLRLTPNCRLTSLSSNRACCIKYKEWASSNILLAAGRSATPSRPHDFFPLPQLVLNLFPPLRRTTQSDSANQNMIGSLGPLPPSILHSAFLRMNNTSECTYTLSRGTTQKNQTTYRT